MGALFKQKVINPIDYVYNALNVRIERLNGDSVEANII
jgi:hypothetical protein